MKEKRREPEVPETNVPVVECLNGPAKITSKEFAPIHLWEVASSRMLVLQVRKWMQVCWKCSYAHRQVDEQPCKRFKNNGDRSALAMLKQSEQHDHTGISVVCDSSITRQFGMSRYGAAEVSIDFRKSSNIRKPIRCVQFTKAVVRHANIRHQNPGMICPRWSSSA